MEIVKVDYLGEGQDYQNYDNQVTTLIRPIVSSSYFGAVEDYIEYFIYDPIGNLLSYNYYHKNYTPTDINPQSGLYRSLELSPEQDIKQEGFNRGTTSIRYNFLKNILESSQSSKYWIKEISSDRTEIRLCKQGVTNLELEDIYRRYREERKDLPYYPDFYLNLGLSKLLIGVNTVYVEQNGLGSILVKLYEPLSQEVVINTELWIVEKIAESVEYAVNIEIPTETQIDYNILRGPNYNVSILEKSGQSTPYYSYTDIFNTTTTSSYQQALSYYDDKSIEINVDYSNFDNFIHFSSAKQRIYNFIYKLQLIESYSLDLITLSDVASNNSIIVSSSKTLVQSKINALIENFDIYEYYLYFESGSNTWPKSNSKKPYSLYSVTSSQAINWLGSETTEPSTTIKSILYSASLYDINNKDCFTNSIPSYIREDDTNEPYHLFLNLVGQHFDNIWLYLKDLTNKYNAENSLLKGVSKDLIENALSNFGIDLYTNTSISSDLSYTLLGINSNGTTVVPTGSEIIDYFVTQSGQELVSGKDVTLEYRKRLYHNLPYILKTKGTTTGVKAILNSYGIPDTMLRVNEFGGTKPDEQTYLKNRYTLAYLNTGSANLIMPWLPQAYYDSILTGSEKATIVPDTIEFRFKSIGRPGTYEYATPTSYYTQSLFEITSQSVPQLGVWINYNSASANSSSFYEDYGSMILFLSGSNGYISSSTIYLPFFNTSWWNIMVKRETGSLTFSQTGSNNVYWLYVKQGGYNREGIPFISQEESASINVNGTTSASYNRTWNTYYTASTPVQFGGYLGGLAQRRFQGYFHEFRYWNIPLSESAFNEHVYNSLSYKGNTTTGSITELTFRLPLGNDLLLPYVDATGSELRSPDYIRNLSNGSASYIGTNVVLRSVHPIYTGSFYRAFNGQFIEGIASFLRGVENVSYAVFTGSSVPRFYPIEIAEVESTPSVGSLQRVNNRVRVETVNRITESVLSPYISIEKILTGSSKSTLDLEIGFSPADILNEDIVAQFGAFNVENYIGRPSDRYSSSYSELDTLRFLYFQKFIGRLNLADFIRLTKYYDNSSFKMLKDYVPARANLSTGVIIKPHILESSKQVRFEPQVSTSSLYFANLTPPSITGSNPEGVSLNTRYTQSLITPSGTQNVYRSDLRESITGEFGGSEIRTVTQVRSQIETSSITYPWTSSVAGATRIFTTYSVSPLLNNISGSKKSRIYLSIDYSSDSRIPVNRSLISGAYNLYGIRLNNPASTVLDSQYWPFAEMQDYYDFSEAIKIPRFDGSKLESLLYNTYTEGDNSYGKTAAIDKIKLRYAYLVNIYTASFGLPNRTNAQIKYLIDNEENTLNLTKVNNNIFDIQTIFKSGEKCQVSLFDYNPANPDIQYLTNNQDFTLYEGGWRYSPILYNVEGSSSLLYRLVTPEIRSSSISTPSRVDLISGDAGYWSGLTIGTLQKPLYALYMPVTMSSRVSSIAYDTNVEFTITNLNESIGSTWRTYQGIKTIPSGASAPYMWNEYIQYGYNGTWDSSDSYTISIDSEYYINPATGTSSVIMYTSSITDNNPDWYAATTDTVKMSATQSAYYNRFIFSGSYPGLETPVLSCSLAVNDMIKFYSVVSGWVEGEEYRVKAVANITDTTGSFIYITLDRNLNPEITDNATIPSPISKYIVHKHIPDETNLILRYTPSTQISQEGLVYPEYLDSEVKENSGNVIQSLKANNLI